MATEIQIETIEHRRVDQTARDMAAEGVTLTEEQAEEVGEAGVDWLRTRLGLTIRVTDTGNVVCAPRVEGTL